MKTKFYILLTMLLTCVMQVKGEVVTETHEVIVGDGTFATNWQGFCSCMSSQSIQNLYLPSEIGTSGFITKLAYQSANSMTSTAPTDKVKVYMAQVDQTTLTTDNKLSTSQMMLVYEGTVSMAGISAKGWVEVTLDTPFLYGGEKSLVVAVSNNSSKVNSRTTYCSTSKSSRSVASTSSSNPDDVDRPSSYLANTRFTIESSKKFAPVNLNGSSSSTYANGFGLHYEKTSNQTLYLAKEIVNSGLITQIAFECSGTWANTTQSGTVTVWMAETEQTTLTTDNMVEIETRMTPVYDGSMTFGVNSNGWEVLSLSTPFNYSGKKNLIVAVSAEKNSISSKQYKAKNIANRLVRSTKNADVFDKTGKEDNSYVPNIRFTFESETYTYGTGTANNAWTGLTGSAHTASYNLYLPSEVGSAGVIGSIGYQVSSSVSTTSTDAVKIYMAEVSDSTLTTSNKLAPSDMTLVFSGNVTLGGRKEGDWIDVSLNCPFSYSGKGNLLVAITNTNSPSSSNYSRYTTVSNRTLYTYSSSNLSDATTPGSSLPNAKFTFAIHNCGRCLVNTICSVCGNEPTDFDEELYIYDSRPYKRTVMARNPDVTYYIRNIAKEEIGKWTSLYVPVKAEYTSDLADVFDLAEIQTIGVMKDTDGDGIIGGNDDKQLIVSILSPGPSNKRTYIEPNTPYLIRPKTEDDILLESVDLNIYPVPDDMKSMAVSTMKEELNIYGVYDEELIGENYLSLENGALVKASEGNTPIQQFRWKALPYTKRGTEWNPQTIDIYAHRFGVTELVDNDNIDGKDFVSYTKASDEVVDNLLYERKFVERQEHNWQSMYLPFDVVVEEAGDDVYPKYAKFESITTEGGVDYINIKKCVAGEVIEANTPCLVCVDVAQTLTYAYSRATLKPASSATNTVFNSGLATYTLIGRYAPYQSSSEWYAISKKDGDFHPMTSTAKLPPYRFYMTIQKKTAGAGELRVVIRDVDEMETAIDSIVDDSEESDAIYTLDGRKVQEDSLQPGIYVKNGKKISVKK